MPIPNPSFDNKPYQELIEEAKRKIAIYSQIWTDNNASDPGITFLELFAWLTETQIYMLDKISQRNYFKFLKLLGTSPQIKPPIPPEIHLTLEATSATNVIQIPKESQFQAVDRADNNDVFFDTVELINVIPLKIYHLATISHQGIHDVTGNLDPGNAALAQNFFYAFSDDPIAGNASFYIGLDKANPAVNVDILKGEKTKLSVFLYEKDLPPVGKHGSEPPSIVLSNEVQWEYLAFPITDSGGDDGPSSRQWLPLHLEQDTTYSLIKSGNVSFKLPFAESDKYLFSELSNIEEESNTNNTKSKELFWIRCRLVKDHYEISPRISKILLNTVKAKFGILSEDLFSSNGMPNQIFKIEDKKTARPIIEIIEVKTLDSTSGTERVWMQVDDFDSAGPEDESYMFDILKSEIIFGNDIKGKIPNLFDAINVKFRAADVIHCGHVLPGNEFASTTIFLGIRASSHFESSSGNEGESIPTAFAHFRKNLREPFKGVSSADIESIAMSTPGLRVARAKAYASKEEGEENTVMVIVVPFSFDKMPLPSKGFIDTVCYHVDKHRLITTQICVIAPQYVGIVVQASISVKSKADPQAVKERLAVALDNFLSPISRRPEQNAWAFGRDVYRSNIIKVMEDIDGLECVVELTLGGIGNPMNFENDNTSGDVLIKNNSLVYLASYSFDIVLPNESCKIERTNNKKEDLQDNSCDDNHHQKQQSYHNKNEYKEDLYKIG